MPTLAELRAHFAAFKARLRARRAFADVLQVEVAEDIAADVSAEQAKVGALGYTAEQADREADRLIVAAEDPASPGGCNITPAEMRPIRRLINGSAERDHQITETCRA